MYVRTTNAPNREHSTVGIRLTSNLLLLQRAFKFGITYRNVSRFRPKLVAVMILHLVYRWNDSDWGRTSCGTINRYFGEEDEEACETVSAVSVEPGTVLLRFHVKFEPSNQESSFTYLKRMYVFCIALYKYIINATVYKLKLVPFGDHSARSAPFTSLVQRRVFAPNRTCKYVSKANTGESWRFIAKPLLAAAQRALSSL